MMPLASPGLRRAAKPRGFTVRPLQIVMVLLIMALSVLFAFPEPSLLDPTIVLCLLIAYVFLIRAFRRPVAILRNLPSMLTIEALFLLFYFLVFYYPYQSYLLFDDPLTHSRFFRDTFAFYSQQAIILSTIGLLAFCLGIDSPRFRAGDRVRKPFRPQWSPPERIINFTITALLAISIATYVGLGFSNANEARYTGSASGGSAANIYDVIVLLSVMLMPQGAWALRRRALDGPLLIGLVLAAAWAMRMLIATDRNNFFLVATAAIAAFSALNLRLRFVPSLAMLASAVILYNAIEVVRALPDPSFSSIYEQITSEKPADEEAGDSSFSTTTVTVRAAIATVPDHVPWGWGKYKALGVAGVVPFLRGFVLPDGADTTADVLTTAILGRFAHWGVGSSIVADCYMDFGLVGVIALMFLIGWMGQRIQSAAIAHPSEVLPRTVYFITIAYFSEYPRYSFEFPINALVWGTSLLLLLAFVASDRRRLRRPARRSRNPAAVRPSSVSTPPSRVRSGPSPNRSKERA